MRDTESAPYTPEQRGMLALQVFALWGAPVPRGSSS